MHVGVSEEQYREACNMYYGWCTNCEDFCADVVEPDATEYLCPICEERTVMGAEEALLQGEIEIGEE